MVYYLIYGDKHKSYGHTHLHMYIYVHVSGLDGKVTLILLSLCLSTGGHTYAHENGYTMLFIFIYAYIFFKILYNLMKSMNKTLWCMCLQRLFMKSNQKFTIFMWKQAYMCLHDILMKSSRVKKK